MSAKTPAERLRRGVEEIAAEIGGVVSVAIRDVRRGRALELRAGERLPSASVVKVPILIELLARAEARELSLEDRIPLRDADKVPGAGVLSMLHEGLELTLEDLAHLMITISDNTASNLLIDLLTCDRINDRLEQLGLEKTRVARKFYDFEARDRGLDNWTAAGELADLLVGVEKRAVVSPAVCEKTLAIMRKQQHDQRIPKLLPPGTPVANKTGTITGVVHDIGIIYAPAGPLAVAVLTSGIEDESVAEGGIRHIARLAYHHWGLAD
jgi:beta-lactamase class A